MQRQVEAPRGKRGKAKKMKEKYADQDEDERNIRMKMLGHKLKQPAVHPPAADNAIAKWGKEPKEAWAATGSTDGVDRAARRAAAKLSVAQETQDIAAILKEEGLLDADSMQQLDFMVRVPSMLVAHWDFSDADMSLATGHFDWSACSRRHPFVCGVHVRAVGCAPVFQVQGMLGHCCGARSQYSRTSSLIANRMRRSA